jgi:hypothetical protein
LALQLRLLLLQLMPPGLLLLLLPLLVLPLLLLLLLLVLLLLEPHPLWQLLLLCRLPRCLHVPLPQKIAVQWLVLLQLVQSLNQQLLLLRMVLAPLYAAAAAGAGAAAACGCHQAMQQLWVPCQASAAAEQPGVLSRCHAPQNQSCRA